MANVSNDTIKAAVKLLQSQGETGSDGLKDSLLIHINPRELPKVQAALGEKGSVNPRTGLLAFKYGADTNEGGNHGFGGGGGSASAGNHDGGSGGDSGGDRFNVNNRTTPAAANNSAATPATAATPALSELARQALNAVSNAVSSTPAPATPTNMLQQAQASNQEGPGVLSNQDLGSIGNASTGISQGQSANNLRRALSQRWNLLG